MGSARTPTPPRTVVLLGPQGVGKTTLMEALLAATEAIPRKGRVDDGTSVGDASPEARARKHSTELTLARFSFLGEDWMVIDTPGSIELAHLGHPVLMVADAAIVVADPEPERATVIQPTLRRLDELGVPHMVFVNRIDAEEVSVSTEMAALQEVSARPLVLRQVPIREGEQVTGYVDLISERAYRYQPGQPSELIQIPDSVKAREEAARQDLLESLADFDDTLLEQLLEEVQPPKGEIYEHLGREFAEDLVVPVLFGSADQNHGIRRLLKALRHDVPGPEASAARFALPAGSPLLQVFATDHAPHAGKMSYARVWRGSVATGQTIGGLKLGALYAPQGGEMTKQDRAEAGQVVAINRMDELSTGDLLSGSGVTRSAFWPEAPTPVFSMAVATEQRGDDVKLTGALARLTEEDPGIVFRHEPDTNELLLEGQGDVHLRLAGDRLARKGNVQIAMHRPAVPYKETIRKGTEQHARFKRQTGGHGQFADIVIEVKPLPRGTGFAFEERVVGGAVPRQYIPAVEAGVKDYLGAGPLGFPVVDVAVTLVTGQFHSVDSSDQAFRTCGRMAMSEAMPSCGPVLLEPIMSVTIAVPSAVTPKAQRIVSARRGQILGFDARDGWPGWDVVTAHIPQAEMADLIIELRSLSLGVGTFEAAFDHLAELSGREADQVVNMKQEERASA